MAGHHAASNGGSVLEERLSLHVDPAQRCILGTAELDIQLPPGFDFPTTFREYLEHKTSTAASKKSRSKSKSLSSLTESRGDHSSRSPDIRLHASAAELSVSSVTVDGVRAEFKQVSGSEGEQPKQGGQGVVAVGSEKLRGVCGDAQIRLMGSLAGVTGRDELHVWLPDEVITRETKAREAPDDSGVKNVKVKTRAQASNSGAQQQDGNPGRQAAEQEGEGERVRLIHVNVHYSVNERGGGGGGGCGIHWLGASHGGSRGMHTALSQPGMASCWMPCVDHHMPAAAAAATPMPISSSFHSHAHSSLSSSPPKPSAHVHGSSGGADAGDVSGSSSSPSPSLSSLSLFQLAISVPKHMRAVAAGRLLAVTPAAGPPLPAAAKSVPAVPPGTEGHAATGIWGDGAHGGSGGGGGGGGGGEHEGGVCSSQSMEVEAGEQVERAPDHRKSSPVQRAWAARKEYHTFTYRLDVAVPPSQIGFIVAPLIEMADIHTPSLSLLCPPSPSLSLSAAHPAAVAAAAVRQMETFSGAQLPLGGIRMVVLEEGEGEGEGGGEGKAALHEHHHGGASSLPCCPLLSPLSSSAGLLLHHSSLLHPPHSAHTQAALSLAVGIIRAVTAQWFGTFLLPSSPADSWLLEGLAGYVSVRVGVRGVLGGEEAAYRREVERRGVLAGHAAGVPTALAPAPQDPHSHTQGHAHAHTHSPSHGHWWWTTSSLPSLPSHAPTSHGGHLLPHHPPHVAPSHSPHSPLAAVPASAWAWVEGGEGEGEGDGEGVCASELRACLRAKASAVVDMLARQMGGEAFRRVVQRLMLRAMPCAAAAAGAAAGTASGGGGAAGGNVEQQQQQQQQQHVPGEQPAASLPAVVDGGTQQQQQQQQQAQLALQPARATAVAAAVRNWSLRCISSAQVSRGERRNDPLRHVYHPTGVPVRGER